MNPFAYARAGTLAEAGKHIGRGGVPKLAGIDLLGRMKRDTLAPSLLVDLTGITALSGIRTEGRSWRFGAATTLAALAAARLPPPLAGIGEAALGAATPQIRNRATLAGNLMQSPRCWYLQDGEIARLYPQQAERLARQGRNEQHAILGNDGQVFCNCGNLAPVLLALGAELELGATDGSDAVSRMPLRELYRKPAGPDDFGLRLPPGRLITAVLVEDGGRASAHVELRQKESYDWATAIAGVAVTVDGGKITACEAWLGAVAPIPWHATRAEAALVGKAPSHDLFVGAARAELAAAKPLAEGGYKVAMARWALAGALEQAARRARTG